MFKVLYLRHHSEPVASPNLDNILLAIFTAQQLEGEIDEFRRVGETSDAAVSIKVGTQTYVVDTHHIDGMLKMGDSVHDVGFTLFTQESVIERGMSHTPFAARARIWSSVRLRGTSQSARLLLWLQTIGVWLISSAS